MPDLPGATPALGQVDEGLGAATVAAKGRKGMVLCLIRGDLMPAKTHHVLMLKKSSSSAQTARSRTDQVTVQARP